MSLLDHIVEAYQAAQLYITSQYDPQTSFQDLLFSYVAKVEYKLLEANDLNLNAANGHDMLAGLLNTCN